MFCEEIGKNDDINIVSISNGIYLPNHTTYGKHLTIYLSNIFQSQNHLQPKKLLLSHVVGSKKRQLTI